MGYANRNAQFQRVVEIHEATPWLLEALREAFPEFPLDLLRPLLQSSGFNNALLPLGRLLNGRSEISML
jgi:hypothetical protein